MRRFLFATFVVLATTGFDWLERWVAPNSRLLDEHWQKRDPGASTVVDHAAWAAFLDRYLEVDDAGVNRVRYAAVSSADRAALDAYVERLAATQVTALAPDEQLAYWLNLYNVLTVQAVLDNYPVGTIRDINGVWRNDRITVEGRALSLDDIEHGIVRPIFNEPLIHYAVNCAAVGCPDLQPQPFTSAQLDQQLDRAARAYVNDPRGVTMTVGGDVTASSIYNWFGDDFGGSDAAILAHLRTYAAEDLRARLGGATSIDQFAYDWALNDGS